MATLNKSSIPIAIIGIFLKSDIKLLTDNWRLENTNITTRL